MYPARMSCDMLQQAMFVLTTVLHGYVLLRRIVRRFSNFYNAINYVMMVLAFGSLMQSNIYKQILLGHHKASFSNIKFFISVK